MLAWIRRKYIAITCHYNGHQFGKYIESDRYLANWAAGFDTYIATCGTCGAQRIKTMHWTDT